VDTVDHYYVMVGQLIDNALIGGVVIRLTMSDGTVVEGVPAEPGANPTDVAEELDDTGYARRFSIAGADVDLAEVRQAAIVRPSPRPR
jgi:hypothetical protein